MAIVAGDIVSPFASLSDFRLQCSTTYFGKVIVDNGDGTVDVLVYNNGKVKTGIKKSCLEKIVFVAGAPVPGCVARIVADAGPTSGLGDFSLLSTYQRTDSPLDFVATVSLVQMKANPNACIELSSSEFILPVGE